MHPVVLVTAAIIVALLVFAGLLLFGTGLVRWLRLPTDLPEGPRFEPPAPTPVDDPAGAPERAAAQALVAARGTRARALWQAAVTAHETGHPQAAACEAAARAGEAAFRAGDDAALTAAEKALDDARR